MPTLRLEEVLKEHTITPELAVYVEKLRKKGTTFDKLDADTASDLKAIADILNILTLDLFKPVEQLYRLKIIDIAYKKYPAPTCVEQLKMLHDDMKAHSVYVSFPLLCIYATQSLPLDLLSRDELRIISDFLKTDIDGLKQEASPPNQTISIEPYLKSFAITIDDLTILLTIPKEFIHWIDLSEKKFDFFGKKYTISMCSIPPFSWFCR
ncbi:MAG: hypothetical protein IM596_15685 [Pseudanabaena sp. M051S1SP2A07QC]|nr:hypothetical protein [Pseudanabaena sp. M090S1SP2A07QC]MCA6518001.1 hypothetical protein [Pseudanabaena sp. M110S1SP2A07QC]MCA6523238.1 hypothetical protein [Pseudanabaena sp. M051S1SP2A07QC]MCA6526510.1 hypothetical protein [Pseudanabaena sp. M179S2SP2A07QC]